MFIKRNLMLYVTGTLKTMDIAKTDVKESTVYAFF